MSQNQSSTGVGPEAISIGPPVSEYVAHALCVLTQFIFAFGPETEISGDAAHGLDGVE